MKNIFFARNILVGLIMGSLSQYLHGRLAVQLRVELPESGTLPVFTVYAWAEAELDKLSDGEILGWATQCIHDETSAVFIEHHMSDELGNRLIIHRTQTTPWMQQLATASPDQLTVATEVCDLTGL